MLSELEPAIINLMKEIGCRRFSFGRLPGSANNQVFRIETDRRQFLLKVYFRHHADTRDRLGAEFEFLRFAWDRGLRCIPEPLRCDGTLSLGLYEFVVGRRPEPEEIGENEVKQAADFFLELNLHKDKAEASGLPVASEACFSIGSHVQCVERRLQRLEKITSSSPVDLDARDFIRNDLMRVWGKTRRSIDDKAREKGLSIDTELDLDERCLSPSDFGFHNALLTPAGKLRFLDFEYAGWDDPAKMICDFFCQQAVPVPLKYYGWFSRMVTSGWLAQEQILARSSMLLPLYRIKWCCIILNDFLPEGNARREFAGSNDGHESRKALQLQKAQALLARLD